MQFLANLPGPRVLNRLNERARYHRQEILIYMMVFYLLHEVSLLLVWLLVGCGAVGGDPAPLETVKAQKHKHGRRRTLMSTITS